MRARRLTAVTTQRDPANPAAIRSTRDAEPAGTPARHKAPGKSYVAVIGINAYRAWGKLENAVQDARGALNTFVQLGFEARPPLFDDDATRATLHRLVTDDLRTLGANDSLVVFFAGHGYTVTTTFEDGTLSKKGYLIPVDAELSHDKTAGWLKLDAWLSEISQLPPKHILVILDACHSGVALDPVIRWRGADTRLADPIEALRARRSRRIITSALDNQLATDSGPMEGHSLFTGCLIEALTGGLAAKTGLSVTTGSELGVHVRQRVSSYPESKQTPDFGALQLDNRGELIIELPAPPPRTLPRPLTMPPRHGAETIRSRSEKPPAQDGKLISPSERPSERAWGAASLLPKRRQEQRAAPAALADIASATHAPIAPPAKIEPPPSKPAPSLDAPAHCPSEPVLEPAFVAALERHDEHRRRGRGVLSVVTADPMTALTGWATWAAARGRLTLATEAIGLGAATEAVLTQMPWLRLLPAARDRLATTARLDAKAVEAALDSRSAREREAWIDRVSRHDLHARVSGWLLSALREPWAQVPDLKAAPVQGSDLLSILCDLGAPITVLFHHAEPSETWLEYAVQTAAELVGFLPKHALAVDAPAEMITRVLQAQPESAARSLARQGRVPLAARTQRVQDQPRRRTEQRLHAALAEDPRTAGLFETDVPVPIHDRDRAIEVDLVARDALLAVELDDWYHSRDPQAYHRDRIKDVWLQRAGFFVMRFLVEDVEERLAQTVDEIALGLAGRRASGSFVEKPQ